MFIRSDLLKLGGKNYERNTLKSEESSEMPSKRAFRIRQTLECLERAVNPNQTNKQTS